ncbi:MAG: hypothetical protein JWM99_2724, partial [Verrucomicrobiales bacterium]|nr:hypothetical protein [Verrucomicrobiales bacterium]
IATADRSEDSGSRGKTEEKRVFAHERGTKFHEKGGEAAIGY